MTMPAIMNCPHQGDGWCLSCVGVLNNENVRLRSLIASYVTAMTEHPQVAGEIYRELAKEVR